MRLYYIFDISLFPVTSVANDLNEEEVGVISSLA